MSDQMPDEVWVADDWLAHYDEPWEGGTHYVRADLYEQAEAEQRRTASRLAEVLMQYTAAKDERDRLRALIDRMIADARLVGLVNMTDYWKEWAQEALDHDD